MLRQKASINPAPPRPLAECIAVDVLALEKRDGKENVCYICMESDRVEPSPCDCEAPCHVYPCLELSIEQTGSSKCTICRSEFTSSALQALASSVLPKVDEQLWTHGIEVSATTTVCQNCCGMVMSFLFNAFLVLVVGGLIVAIFNMCF